MADLGPPIVGVMVWRDERPAPMAEHDRTEYYHVGDDNVTSIEWHSQPGHMTAIPTIRVFRHGVPHSEHPFHNVLGVYFDRPQSHADD